ncbi:MAG: 5'/3'-nucleotidase SurE [Candidatus Eisenbacteria sp.]|nr:5'/3'-nucleotidase SurE [Candidatus Eisenbacteria bacterium]
MPRELILLTNDDGIRSRGLWAAAQALQPLGELLVIAPDRQWSGGGRSMPHHSSGKLQPTALWINGERVAAYAVDASPAQAVVHGLLEVADRPPALVVSGINHGANLGLEVTISGTVGAALEAGAFGIPSMAVSLEMDPTQEMTGDEPGDTTAAIAITRRLAGCILGTLLPPDVDVLNVNVPADASPQASIRVTRLSRRRYYLPRIPERCRNGEKSGYQQIADYQEAEPDSDVWVVKVGGDVSVTPLSLDLTARLDLRQLGYHLSVGLCRQPQAARSQVEVASPEPVK